MLPAPDPRLPHELQRWHSYAQALRQEDRTHFHHMLHLLTPYLAALHASPHRPTDTLVMTLLLIHHRLLHDLETQLIHRRTLIRAFWHAVATLPIRDLEATFTAARATAPARGSLTLPSNHSTRS